MDLGILQKVLAMCLQDTSIQITLAVLIGVLFASLDTFSDIMVMIFLFQSGFLEMGCIVAIFDLIPGLLIFFHHVNSNEWTTSTRLFQLFCVVMVALQPFSLFITNAVWLFNITSPHWHHLACSSQIIHGSFESPVQMINLMVMMGTGVLEVPWEETVVIADEYNNQLNLGKVGTISLALSFLSLLKASISTMQLDGFHGTLNGAIFGIINLSYRIPALAIFVLYTKYWSTSLFLVLLLVNLITFTMYIGNNKLTHFKISSSIVMAIFLPTCVSRCPYKDQLVKDDASKEESTRNNYHKKRMSSLISLITLPLIYAACLLYTSDAADE